MFLTIVFPLSSSRGQCVRQFRPAQLSTWIHQQQHLSIHPFVILSFCLPPFFLFFPLLFPLSTSLRAPNSPKIEKNYTHSHKHSLNFSSRKQFLWLLASGRCCFKDKLVAMLGLNISCSSMPVLAVLWPVRIHEPHIGWVGCLGDEMGG